jgi:LemA protein
MIFTYNDIVKKKNHIEFGLRSIDVELKKRYEALPNIVTTAKKYMESEGDVFANIAKLRSGYDSASGGKFELEKEISVALKSISVTLESYPDLKAIDAILMLQRSINEFAEQISAAQRNYNASVLSYNNAISVFPGNLVAKLFKFKREEFMQIIAENEKKNIDVSALL